MNFDAALRLFTPSSPEHQAKESIYADAVGKAARTRDYQRLVDTAFGELQSVDYQSSGDSRPVPGRPQLQAPRMAIKGADPEAEDTLTLLLASLIMLLGEVNITGLKARLESLKAAAEAAAAGHQELSDKYLAALEVMLAAAAVHDQASKDVLAAKAQLDSAQAKLEQAQAKLDETPVDTPEHTEALKALDQAKQAVAAAGPKMKSAETVREAANEVLIKAAANAEKFARQVEALNGQPAPEIIEGMKKQMSAAATMIELVMGSAKVLGEIAENKAEAEMETWRTMQAARQEFLDKAAEEYSQQVRKAEASSKAMGCIGKVLGGLLMVASIAGAVFTGGASLVLAGVGLALTIGDQVGKAITGVSFMEKATQPLMDRVLAPLIQAIGKSIADVLQTMGVDAQSAETAGMILGAIVGAVATVAVVVAAVVLFKSAGARLGAQLSNMLSPALNKLLPHTIKQGARALTDMMADMLANVQSQLLKTAGLTNPNSLAMVSNQISAAMAVIEAVGVAAESAMGVKSGMHQKEAARHRADAQMLMAISETLKVAAEKIFLAYAEDNTAERINKIGLKIQANTQDAAHAIAGNIKA